MSKYVSLDWQIDLDSHGMVHWECQFNGDASFLVGESDWRSVLLCLARMSCLPEFPDKYRLKCFDDLGENCIMDFSTWGRVPGFELLTIV